MNVNLQIENVLKLSGIKKIWTQIQKKDIKVFDWDVDNKKINGFKIY